VIDRRTFVFNELEHPAFVARGREDGPSVSLLGGIHGCEYSSIAAVTRFMTELDERDVRGTITAVPVVSMESFRQRSPFVVPADGKNLNRTFPGSPDGTYTDRLARSIFDELIAPADAVIDLHGGDLVEALEPFAIYEASAVEAQAHALAVAFGLGYVVREEGGLGGLTSSAAAAAGVPAIIAEAGGCGQLEEGAVQLLVRGVRNALRQLGVLPGDADAPPAGQRLVGSFIWLRSRAAGWWESAVAAGDEVGEGQLLGQIRNLWGDPLEEIAAPRDGVILFLTTSAAVAADGLLLGIGADLSPLG
jgi:predicted deacylase